MLDENYYNYLKTIKKSPNDVIAILSTSNDYQYILFTMGNESSIKKYLPNCDGKAISIVVKRPFYVLMDEKTDAMLFFRKIEEIPGFSDIEPEDYPACDYVRSLF